MVETDIDSNTTQIGLIKKIELGIRCNLSESEKARALLDDVWKFLQRVEVDGNSIKPKSTDEEIIFEEFSLKLADTINRITDVNAKESQFSAKYDGLVLLIDEADKCSRDIDLGSFVKLLLERLQKNKCENIMIVLAGLPEIKKKLYDGHPSSLRIFEELFLDRLNDDDVSRVIDKCLMKANSDNTEQVTITDDARKLLINYSEGYPHFIQQFGFCAYEYDKDNVINQDDVIVSAFSSRGALDLIADRYYRNDFYNKIQKESYRQVLRIMADNSDEWVSKKQIKEKFRGKPTVFDNAINALRKRHIIMTNEKEKGKYRLQHKGFAFWIKVRAQEPPEIVKANGTS